MSAIRRKVRSAQVWLDTASLIAKRIVGQAIWYEDRCNWVGASPVEGPGGQPVLTYAALGPELYGGTSGIALFLAELYAATGDRDVRHTAQGAIRHALAREADLPPAMNLGLYAGRIGIALAAARVGALLADDGLVERSRAIVVPLDGVGDEFDLISGRAGAIVGLLVLQELLGEPGLLGAARRLGEELIETAVKENGCWSWASPSFPESRNLAGYSHGAAGAGHGLYELAEATGESAFAQAAEQAFSYERRLFDPQARNWPDLRGVGRRPKQSGAPSFSTFWCHGAPGIALSRLRAYELTGDQAHRDEAAVGVATTQRHVEAAARSGTGNYSLCHGLAGNAEALLYAIDLLGADWATGEALALQVAEAGIEAFAQRGVAWPCGTLGGETPNLMLGLAGIGLFYLRLGDPEIPSVLLMHPVA